jgi:hypothetical protein
MLATLGYSGLAFMVDDAGEQQIDPDTLMLLQRTATPLSLGKSSTAISARDSCEGMSKIDFKLYAQFNIDMTHCDWEKWNPWDMNIFYSLTCSNSNKFCADWLWKDGASSFTHVGGYGHGHKASAGIDFKMLRKMEVYVSWILLGKKKAGALAMTTPAVTYQGTDHAHNKVVTTIRNGATTKWCSGRTVEGATAWKDDGAGGIYVDVDTSKCAFSDYSESDKMAKEPFYFPTLVGKDTINITGMSVPQQITATGFRIRLMKRVYCLKWHPGMINYYDCEESISAALASSLGWYVVWYAKGVAKDVSPAKPCIGSTRSYLDKWQQGENKEAFIDVDTSMCGFASTPDYSVSYATSSASGTFGRGSKIENPTPKGFRYRVYDRYYGTASWAKKMEWTVSWMAGQGLGGTVAPTPSPTTPNPTPSPTKECRICALDFGTAVGAMIQQSSTQSTTYQPSQVVKVSNACRQSTTSIDLIMKTKSVWETKPSLDKSVGSMLQINVRSNSSVVFDFELVLSGTTVPAAVKEVVVSVLDVDATKVEQDGSFNVGSVEATGYASEVHGHKKSKIGDMYLAGVTGSASDSPAGPFGLTKGQEASAVAFKFTDVSSWRMMFSISNPVNDGTGRNFFLAGPSDVMGSSPCP